MLKSFSENISTGAEEFASIAERRSKLMGNVASRMREQLNYYLNTEHTIYKIQRAAGITFDKWEKEDYNNRRKLYILKNLSTHLRKRLSTSDLPLANILKNETYRLIRQFDSDFQLETPPEEYKLEAPWAVREKRDRERRIKREKEEALKGEIAVKKRQKYAIAKMLERGMTPMEIADQLWFDYTWDKEEMLYLARTALAKMPEEKRRKAKLKKKEKKEGKDLAIKTGLQDVEGLSEKNIIPRGEYYLPGVGWY